MDFAKHQATGLGATSTLFISEKFEQNRSEVDFPANAKHNILLKNLFGKQTAISWVKGQWSRVKGRRKPSDEIRLFSKQNINAHIQLNSLHIWLLLAYTDLLSAMMKISMQNLSKNLNIILNIYEILLTYLIGYLGIFRRNLLVVIWANLIKYLVWKSNNHLKAVSSEFYTLRFSIIICV